MKNTKSLTLAPFHQRSTPISKITAIRTSSIYQLLLTGPENHLRFFFRWAVAMSKISPKFSSNSLTTTGTRRISSCRKGKLFSTQKWRKRSLPNLSFSAKESPVKVGRMMKILLLSEAAKTDCLFYLCQKIFLFIYNSCKNNSKIILTIGAQWQPLTSLALFKTRTFNLS